MCLFSGVEQWWDEGEFMKIEGSFFENFELVETFAFFLGLKVNKF